MKVISIKVTLPNGKTVTIAGKQYDCAKKEDRLALITDEIKRNRNTTR